MNRICRWRAQRAVPRAAVEPTKRVTPPPHHAARRSRFRPCIDIHNGKVKQIVGSTLRDTKSSVQGGKLVTNFVSEKPPEWYSRLYRQDELLGGHVILLDRDPATRDAAMAALNAWPGGMHVGGGVTPENASRYLDAGASHVIITSYVFHDGVLDDDRLQKLVSTVGAKRLVLDLSCRFRDDAYWVVTDRWQKFSELTVDAGTLERLSRFCDEFLIHGVDVEGKQCGIDAQLIALLAASSPLPTTYAGGVKDMTDLEQVAEAGNERIDVTVGSALDIFGGSLNYGDVVKWHRRGGNEAHTTV